MMFRLSKCRIPDHSPCYDEVDLLNHGKNDADGDQDGPQRDYYEEDDQLQGQLRRRSHDGKLSTHS